MSFITGANKVRQENLLINGGFDIWQRGAGPFTLDNVYTSDRWYSQDGSGGAPARSVTREQFAVGQTDVPGNPKYFLRHDQTAAATDGKASLQQFIEGVETLAGKTAYYSFFVRGSVADSLDIIFRQNFGSGGAPSAAVAKFAKSNVVYGTDWAEIRGSIDLASIAGKTLGTDGNDNLEFEVRLDSTGVHQVDFANMRLQSEPITTEFERRSLADELALCQRYFRNTGELRLIFSETTISPYENISTHPVTMRATPTATVNNYVDLDGSGATISDVLVDKNSINGLYMSRSASAGSRFRFDVDLDAEL